MSKQSFMRQNAMLCYLILPWFSKSWHDAEQISWNNSRDDVV